MADKQNDLKIVVEAINKASEQLKQVEEDIKGLTETVEEQGTAAREAGIGFGELVAGIITGSFVAEIAVSAFQKLTAIISNLPGMFFEFARGASEVEGLGVALNIVANNAGLTAEAVARERSEIVKHNITTHAANRLLTDLIVKEIDYAQASKVAAAAQDIAAASNMDSSEAVERITQAIATGQPYLLQHMNLTKYANDIFRDYAESIGKTTEELDDVGRSQAIVNYVLEEGEKYAGAYDAAMGNAAKVLRSFQRALKEVSYVFGRVFNKALFEVSDTIYQLTDDLSEWAHQNEKQLNVIATSIGNFMHKVVATIKSFVASIPWDKVIAGFSYVIQVLTQFGAGLKIAYNIIQIFVRGISITIKSVQSLGEALSALIRRDFRSLKEVYTSWKGYSLDTAEAVIGDVQAIGTAFKRSQEASHFDLQEWWKKIGETDQEGWENRLKEIEESGDELTSKQKKQLSDMLRDIEKANVDYERAVAERIKQFNESFDDMVISHRDAIKELTKDLEEGNEDYKYKLADLVEEYNESMETIETRHKEKTESVIEDMEDERKKILEEIEKITEAYNEEVSIIQKEGEDRLSNLKAQLDKEKALGANANQEKINALDQMIAYEKDGLETALSDKKDKYDEEVSDVEEKLNDKLAKLRTELETEDYLFTESMSKRKVQYDEDVLDAKESYEDKRLALQEELDKELIIREKYSDDFARLADAIVEDDLTRLIRKHNEELAEMSRSYDEKIAEIKYKAFGEGEAFTEGFSEGFDAGYPAVEERLDKMGSDIDNVVSKIGSFTSSGNGSSGGSWWSNFIESLPSFPFGRAEKGGVFSTPTIAGEAGAEVVLPLNSPKRMAMIMKSMGIGGGESQGQVVQNFYVTVQDKQDVDVLMERAGFALKQGGGYG